jgi:hypothetical protein
VTDIVAYRSAVGSFRYGMCLTKLILHTHTHTHTYTHTHIHTHTHTHTMNANAVLKLFPEEAKFHIGISASVRRITGFAHYAANILVKASRPRLVKRLMRGPRSIVQ